MASSAKAFSDWHWGIPHENVKHWNDPDYPPGDLIETGKLVELHIREPGKRKDTVIRLNKSEANGSHLVFDPLHPAQRLYILASPEFQARMRKRYRANPNYKDGSKFKALPLSYIANVAGGRHGTPDYPDVDAVPLGILTHVVYATDKKGDGFSFYIHKMGEESGIKPVLAVDGPGRPWIVGGNYTSPNPGITD